MRVQSSHPRVLLNPKLEILGVTMFRSDIGTLLYSPALFVRHQTWQDRSPACGLKCLSNFGAPSLLDSRWVAQPQQTMRQNVGDVFPNSSLLLKTSGDFAAKVHIHDVGAGSSYKTFAALVIICLAALVAAASNKMMRGLSGKSGRLPKVLIWLACLLLAFLGLTMLLGDS
jgi:hypothetical protein